MTPDPIIRLASVVQTLEHVVVPAVDSGNLLAVEQCGVVLAQLRMLERHMPLIGAYHALCLTDLLGVVAALPPVEMLMTASVDCLMRGRKRSKSAALGLGLPSASLRAWRWRIEAPASAASIAAVAISSGVTGRCGDIDGVWIEPVTAQVMMTLSVRFMLLCGV